MQLYDHDREQNLLQKFQIQLSMQIQTAAVKTIYIT